MSLSQSYLAQPAYGYDMVASVTQKGINNAIETYYNDTHTFSAVSFYFIKNTDGTPLQVDQSVITSQTGGVDPLSGTAKIPLTQAQINAVKGSNLWFAFNIYIGNPAGYAGAEYLTINPGSNTVDYYLLCKTLHVAFWNPDNSTWVDILQNTKEEFNINATVNLQTVISSNNVTNDVQNGINYIIKTYNLSSTDLNIQQLLFDADSAVVSPTSTLSGLDSSCSVFTPLMQQFTKSYFATYLAQAPALDYAVTQNNTSTLLPTSMSLFTGALVDSKGNPVPVTKDDAVADLSTINYLFATNGNTLNAGKQFNWNYLDDNGNSQDPDKDSNADVNKYDGAIAINRDAFAKYLGSRLLPYVMENCLQPSISVGTDMYQNEWDVDFTQGALEPLAKGFQPFSQSAVEMDGSDMLLYYASNTSQRSGGWQAADYLSWQNAFELSAVLAGQTLTISQTMTVNIDTVWSGNAPGCAAKGTPVNRTYTDVFNIVIDDSGMPCFINTSSTPAHKDDTTAFTPSQPPANIIGSLNGLISSLTAGNFDQLPVIMPTTFVFPGGNAFNFKDAQFSDNSDLVCHVKYLSEN